MGLKAYLRAMKQDDFILGVAEDSGVDIDCAKKILESLSTQLSERIEANEVIAIPGFGKFESIYEEEKVCTDLSTGEKVMLPPKLSVQFTVSASLKTKLSGHGSANG